jgi:hypothetical protein
VNADIILVFIRNGVGAAIAKINMNAQSITRPFDDSVDNIVIAQEVWQFARCTGLRDQSCTGNATERSLESLSDFINDFSCVLVVFVKLERL